MMIKGLERRGYQFKLVNVIQNAAANGENVLLELDAGLGKRILSYLLYRSLPPDKRAIMITPTSSSLEDTVSTFNKLKECEEESLGKIGYIYGKTRGDLRKQALTEAKFLIATPISLTHTLKKLAGANEHPLNFDYLILNEVDKLVRRTAVRPEDVKYIERKDTETVTFQTARELRGKERELQRSLFTFPWNWLRNQIPKQTCIVGMSATLRDTHMVKMGDTGQFRSELKTIIEDFMPHQQVKVVSMNSLLKSTDLQSYLPKNMSLVRPIGISDPQVQKLTREITQSMKSIKREIYTEYPDLFEKKDFKHVKKGFSLLPENSPLRRQFFKLSLIRKFVVASVPNHYRKFITKFPDVNKRKALVSLVPERSSKIQKVVELTKSWIEEEKKVAVMVSYIKTAREIKRNLQNKVNVFLITGESYNKWETLESFKTSKQSVLVLTPVGGRDLDLPSVDLLIIHDVVNTVKTMYQRLKRARGGLVIFLYYEGGHEKMKVYSVLDKIDKRYPWTTQVSN